MPRQTDCDRRRRSSQLRFFCSIYALWAREHTPAHAWLRLPPFLRLGRCRIPSAWPLAPLRHLYVPQRTSHTLLQASYGVSDYAAEFKRTYTAEELPIRTALLAERLATIKAHPATSTWRAGVNHLTDRTEAELKAMRGVKRSEMHARRGYAAPRSAYAVDWANAPKANPSNTACNDDPDTKFSFCDWRDLGVVTAVKDQCVPSALPRRKIVHCD